MASSSKLKDRKLLVNNHESFDAITNSNDMRVFIDGYAYIAITSRNVTVQNAVTSNFREDGMRYSDHIYREPTSLSFTIIVSKLNNFEYNKLKELYTTRKLVPIKSIAFNCPNAMMEKFSVKDTWFDALEIDVSFKEVLVSGTSYSLDIDASFQLENASPNAGNISTSTNVIQNQQALEAANYIIEEGLSFKIPYVYNFNPDGYYILTGNNVTAGKNNVVILQDKNETENIKYQNTIFDKCSSV